jgi:polysaccharide chain length determinant protein (PEP-CTERM system associated)
MNNGIHEIHERALALVRMLWAWRWVGVSAAWVVAVIGMFVVSTMSNRYQAGAKVYVDTQTVLKPLMAGLTVQPDIDQQVRMLAKTLVSRPNVERLMDNPAIGLVPAIPADRDASITILTSKIKVEPAGSGNLYEISYRDTDPQRARKLVQSLVDLFMNSTTGGKRRDSEEAGRFIEEQIKAHEEKLVEAENRVKEFKLRNFGLSGVSNQDYFSRMSALSESVQKMRTDLHAAEQTRDSYKKELASESPQLPPDLPPVSATATRSEAEQRLEAAQRQLDELLRRYTDEHPDVVSTKRLIASMEQQVKREQAQRAKAEAERGQPGAAATSPVYQRIRMALSTTEAEIASLRSRLAAEQQRLDEARAMAHRVPQVEAELSQLNRDYEVIRRNYEVLVQRRESASLGVKLDESAQLAEFRLVEPPRVASAPVAPSRTHLALGVVLVSLLAGAGAAYGMSVLKPTFGDIKALSTFTNRPVIGSVSLFVTPERAVIERGDRRKFVAMMAVLVLLQGTWAVWIQLSSRV